MPPTDSELRNERGFLTKCLKCAGTEVGLSTVNGIIRLSPPLNLTRFLYFFFPCLFIKVPPELFKANRFIVPHVNPDVNH